MMRHLARHKTLLTVSLLVNLFLICVAAGGAWRWMHHGGEEAAIGPHSMRLAAADLSPARRVQLRRALQEMRRDNPLLIEAARTGRKQVLQALATDPFDASALDDALARTRTADSALRARLEQAMVGFAADLLPAERSLLVGAMTERGALRGFGPARGEPQRRARHSEGER